MNSIKTGTFFRILFFLLCFSTGAFAQKAASSEDDLKKQADRYFASDDYEDALVPYSQLLSLYPQNAVYNYRYGICLIIAGKEKSNAANYLQKASADPGTPEEVWYYLAKAYMVIGRFSDAQTALQKFSQTASPAKQKKLESDVLLANCTNAIEIQKTRKNVVILDSRELARNEFSHFYDWSLANGRYVPAAEQFLSSQDKDKLENPVMFITNDKQIIYMASYGKNSSGGKDIYIIRKMPNGQWSQPENLGSPINTTANEDFPYLDRDGRTMYFCSKGDKSIGGYDIFKSTFDFNTGKWSEPENMGWPINTIGDDYLYVPVNKGREAYYATTIESDKKSISIRKIQLPDQNSNQVTISGLYFPQDQRVRRDARISVLLGNGQGLVTSVYTDPQTGKYEVDLEPGKDYVIVVEGGGYLPHAESFSIPSGLNNPDLRQVVKLNRGKENESMILENYFYPVDLASTQTPSEIVSADYATTADTSALMVVKIDNKEILVTKPGSGKKEDALASGDADSTSSNIIRIEKDEYDPTLEKNLSADDIRQKEEETKRAHELAEDEKSPKYDVTISNEELARIAATDAQTARIEADSLKKEVARLNSAAEEREGLADSYVNKALKAEETDKPVYQNKAYELRTESENLRRQAADLQIAANAKENEAVSSEQDAKSLMQTIDTQPLAANKKGGKKSGNSSAKSGTNQSASKSEEHQSENPNLNSGQTSSPSETQTEVSGNENQTSPENSNEPVPANEVANEKGNASNTTTVSNVSSEKTSPSEKQNESTQSVADLKSQALSQSSDISKPETDTDKKSDNEIAGTNVNDVKDGNSNATPSSSDNSTDTDKSVKSNKQEDALAVNKANTKSAETVQQITPTSNSEAEGNTHGNHINTITDTKSDSNTTNTNAADTKEQSTGVNEIAHSNAPAPDQSKSENQNADANAATQVNSDDVTSKSAPVAKTENSSLEENKEQAQVKQTSESATENTQTVQNNEKSGAEENSTQQSATSQNANQVVKTEEPASDASLAQNNDSNTNSGNKNQKSEERQNVGTTSESSTGKNTSEPINNTVNKSENSSDVLAETTTATKADENPSQVVPDTAYKSTAELKQYELPPATEERSPMPADINSRKAQPVKEEARLAYQEYRKKYTTSQRLAEQSVELQKRIAVTPSSSERDSLINLSNDLSEQSANTWKESVAQLEAAKQIDPQVKEKMELNEQIVAYNSSLPTNNSTNRTISSTPAGENNNANDVSTPQENPASINSNPSSTSESTVSTTASNTTPVEVPAQEKDETLALTTAPAATEEVVISPPLTEEETKHVEEITNFSVETPNGTEKIKINTEGLDTRHPDFPTYVELNKQITSKQVETINVFAEAVNLNKKAVEEKQEQGRLMDFAETQTDIQKKAKIFVQADSMKALSDADMKAAQEKFKIAQSKTGDVKQVTAQMEEVKTRIAIPGAKVAKQSTASVVHPEQQQTEIASDFAEAQKQEPIALNQDKNTERGNDSGSNDPATVGTTNEKPVSSDSNTTSAKSSNAEQTGNESSVTIPSSSTQQVDSRGSDDATNTSGSSTGFNVPSGSVIASVSPEEKDAFSKNSFSIADKPVYSEQNPIPMNPQLPEGLVFKVQIGAFHNPIPAEKFKGVQPISGETTRPGWIRYCVGLFQTFEPANIVKKEMQSRGFKDAFVVAYYNGKRIDLSEAYAMLTKGTDRLGKDYVAASRKEMALLRANDIRPEKISSVRKGVLGEDEKSFYGNDAAKEMNSVAAVEYAVQVGVYRTPTAPRVLAPLMPLLTEQIRTNLYRFTTDHFTDYATADSMKRVARRNGVSDAFIVIYRNGALATLASVPVSERRAPASSRQTVNATAPSPNNSTPVTETTIRSTSGALENSQTASAPGLVFRVQLGAFRNNIPFTSVVAFLQVADKGITQQTDDRGLHIFYAGDCKDYQTALNLKAEINAKGIADAFVVALRDGKRVVITEDMK